jgi:hypothetical protein
MKTEILCLDCLGYLKIMGTVMLPKKLRPGNIIIIKWHD